jgi:anhydro-N-acetylmuramic acid kinase
MSTNLERLLAVAQKPERIVVGLMSGTSVDSIDVAICQIGPNGCPVKLIQYGERPYSRDLKARLVRVDQLDVRAIAELHVLVAEAFAKAAREVLAESPISICQVDLIGSHGQTVYHHSTVPGALRATLQLGDGDVIAERLGVPVVSDFRARDIAAGGEGAPLHEPTWSCMGHRRRKVDVLCSILEGSEISQCSMPIPD